MPVVTQPARRSGASYDRFTILFHWLTAALVLVQWVGAQMIDLFPSGWPRIDARSLHITLGVALGALLVVRLAWRLTRGRRLPPIDTGVQALAATAVHVGLYLLLAAMVLVGMLLTWARGDSLFLLLKLPRLGDHALAEQMQEVHAAIGWVILAVAGVHAAAALFHHFVWADGVLERMWPAVNRVVPRQLRRALSSRV